MNTRMAPLLGLLMAWHVSLSQAGEADPSYVVQAVEDGDTLLVELDGQAQRIQLLGIDAPENADNPKLKHDMEKSGLEKARLLALGQAATEHLQSLVAAGDEVVITGDLKSKDRYGRILAQVRNREGQILGETMIQAGYAIALPRSQFPAQQAYMRRLDRLERFARKANNGLWGSHPELVRTWYDRTR